MNDKVKVIIDTDPGVDDAMAIMFAALHPKIELLALTSIFGNVSIDVATRNALVLCDVAGLNIPVAKGEAKPLEQVPFPFADFVHGEEGFGTMAPRTPSRTADERPAWQLICDLVDENPGEIILCPIGPLTNIALALRNRPDIVSKVKAVQVMGASIKAGGNATEFAEANIWQDALAAKEVFSADWPVHIIGLDVTHQVMCDNNHFDKLEKNSPKIGGFLNEAVQFYFRFHEKHDGFYGCHMHDPTAVISIIHPEFFTFDKDTINVHTKGEKIGQTYIDSTDMATNVAWASNVDADAVIKIFMDTISTGE